MSEHNRMSERNEMFERIRAEPGIIAALDQSGGNTARALRNYGIGEADLDTAGADRDIGGADLETAEADLGAEAPMVSAMHEMRTRIITSPAFSGDRIIGAILFVTSVKRDIDAVSIPRYLWEQKGIVPFMKIDDGLADAIDDAQLVKPIPELDARLDLAVAHTIFGTKMRSLITAANPKGIDAIVDQQFAIGHRALAAGLVPIIEPEVDRNAAGKADAEDLLCTRLIERLDALKPEEFVMLKLGLPTETNRYADLIAHPQVLRVAALSGGHPRDEANALLAANNNMIASFSRALVEDLRVDQDDETFNQTLNAAIESIYQASLT